MRRSNYGVQPQVIHINERAKLKIIEHSRGGVRTSILVVVMLCVLTIVGVPSSVVAQNAQAATTAKSINIGTKQISVPQGGWTKTEGAYLYYGVYHRYPVKYRVLKMSDGTALLDCDIILFMGAFVKAGGKSDYATSDIRAYLKDGKEILDTSLFTDKEKAQVVRTKLTARSQYRPSGFNSTKYYYTDDASEDNLSFLLSGQEANDLYPNSDALAKNGGNYNAVSYWLRSSSTTVGEYGQNYAAGTVGASAIAAVKVWKLGFAFVNGTTGGVSPASNVNLSNILFTSLYGQTKGTTAGQLEQVGTAASNEWQVTLKDTTKTITVQTGSLATQGGVTQATVPFTASSSDGSAIDQISVVITSGDISSATSEVLYYGKLDTANVSGGTGTFTLPDNLPNGYKVYAMAEDVNGAGFTDYASEPVEVTFAADAKEHTVTFDSDGGTDVPAQKVQDGNTATKPADPTKEGHTFKGWYSEGNAFDFDTPITKDITLTAVWEKNAEPTPDPNPDPEPDPTPDPDPTPSPDPDTDSDTKPDTKPDTSGHTPNNQASTIAHTGSSVRDILTTGLLCVITAGMLWAVLVSRRYSCE